MQMRAAPMLVQKVQLRTQNTPLALAPRSTKSVHLTKSLRLQSQRASHMVTYASFAEGDAPSEAAPAMPSAAPAEEAQVYVGNISWDTDEDVLKQTFSEYGTVGKVNVVRDAEGFSRGFAFVTLPDMAAVDAAIAGMSGMEVDGRSVRCDKVLPRGERPQREERAPRSNASPFRLYVGNLPWSFEEYDLKDAFGEYGEVTDAKVIFDRETGRSRGFGFVTLSSDAEVDAAIENLDGADINGRGIRVNRATSSP
jgi:nucleolin